MSRSLRPHALASVMLLAALAAAMPPPAQAVATSDNVKYYTNWAGDADGNGLDDRLDEDLGQGAIGTVHVFVHYDRPTTPFDATSLQGLGIEHLHRFRVWDDIQAEAAYDALEDIPGLPGVMVVEKFEAADTETSTSMKAIRTAEALDLPVLDGIDHAKAVHQDFGFRGQGMVVAIVDGGVNNAHESLDDLDTGDADATPKLVQKVVGGGPGLPGVRLYAGFGFTGNVGGGAQCIDPDDSSGHGTHMAHIAVGTGGAGTEFQFHGAAPKARMVDVKVRGGGQGGAALGVVGWPMGLEWMILFNRGQTCYLDPGTDRIDVASISLGSPALNDPRSLLSRLLTDVAREGITVVIAAGNSGPGNMTLDNGPEGGILVANANIQGTVRRDDDAIKLDSSRGPRASDGDADAIDELRPDLTAPGHLTTTASHTDPHGYTTSGGTSSATPHVAGVAALMLQANPDLRPWGNLSNEEMGNAGAVPIRDLLQQSAQPKTAREDALPLIEATGRFGLPWNNAWGYGLMDAYKAVQLACPTCPG